MRDIRVRGYDLKTKSWIDGYYIKHINATPCFFNSKEEEEKWYKEHTKHLIAFDGFSDWWMPRDIKVCTTIDEKSIGQFTGIKDKNKKEIYEGDILKIDPGVPNDKYIDKIGKVISDECSFWIEYNNDASLLFDETFLYEVIGNVYENPELLKEE